MLKTLLLVVACITVHNSDVQGQVTFRSRAFTVTTDLNAPIAERLTKHMEIVYAEMTRRFSAFPDRSGVRPQLLLYADQGSYLTGMQERFGADVEGSAGVFVARQDGLAIAAWLGGRSLTGVESTLQHETFHLMHQVRLGGTMPLWLNEGLAEYFERGMVVRGKFKLGIVTRSDVYRLHEHHESGEFMPIKDIVLVDSSKWWEVLREGDAGPLYLQSWAMAHFLIEGDGGRYEKRFLRYMHLCADGMDHARAWERTFGEGPRALEQFQQAWERWLDSVEPDPLSVARERLQLWAFALSELHARGETVISLTELRERLDELGWSVQLRIQGEEHVITAASAEWFELPESAEKARFEVDPTASVPIVISLTGMRGVRPRIEWELITEDNRQLGEEVGTFRSSVQF